MDGHAHPQHEGHGAGHAAHDRHERHSVEMFRTRFLGLLGSHVPAIVWSQPVQHLLGYRAPAFPGSQYIPAVFGTLVFVYGGLPFLKGARNELADRLRG